MHSLLRRVKLLEENTPTTETINVYIFNPKAKVVYRKYGNDKIYMNWEDILKSEYSLVETIVVLPNYDNPNWEAEKDGEWHICVRGEAVINENDNPNLAPQI